MLWNGNKEENSEAIEGDVIKTEVTGLTPYTNYTFCVVANNDMGNGTDNLCLDDIVTLEGGEHFSGETVYMLHFTFLMMQEFNNNF